MKNSVKRPNRQSLSMKLSVGILFSVMAVFILSLGFLFIRSRILVKQEAMVRGERAVATTALRLQKCLEEVEVATNNTAWMVSDNLIPDSLLNYTRRVVELNPHINGCSISLERGVITQDGTGFSAYSMREGDKIETAIEPQYDYFEKVWYKTPREKGEACWVDPYDASSPGTLAPSTRIASYGKPLVDAKGNFIGIISTDLSVTLLTEIVSTQKLYAHSYCVMLGERGDYVVHPDRMKMVKESIFTSFDKEKDPDIIQMGEEMIAGKTGNKTVAINHEDCVVFYQPVAGTAWSLALVIPEKDIFASYNKLGYIVIPLLVIGFLLLLIICWKGVSHFIKPLNQLAELVGHITQGHFDEHLPQSDRIDVVGQLQNNFILMQEAVDENISNLHQMNAATEERNRELDKANRQALEADQRKTQFLQNVSLQLRTPLNIIAGFMQVLREGCDTMTEEEIKTQADLMREHTLSMSRMARMIFDASWMENQVEVDLSKEVHIDGVIQQVAQDFDILSPHDVKLTLVSSLSSTKCIHTNHLYLHRILRELLFNAKKFSSGEYIALRVEETDDVVRFTIEDKGKGFSEEEQAHMFELFAKFDTFSAGLGLGLGLVNWIAHLLKGTLKYDASYTEGARFILEIPNT